MSRSVIEARPLTPAPGGLFSAATVSIDDTDGMWRMGGAVWDTFACPARLALTAPCAGAQEIMVADVSAPPPGTYTFGISGEYTCYTPGMSASDRAAAAMQQAEVGTQKAVERELWAGMYAQRAGIASARYLSDNTATVVTSKGVSIEHGVAALEQAMGDCGLGAGGVIHLSRMAAQLAASAGAVRMDKDGSLRTRLGTPVVAGAGYAPVVVPADPQANAPLPDMSIKPYPDTQWGYVTGPVYVLLSPVEMLSDYVDVSENIRRTVAGRIASVYWDSCCASAAQLDLSL